jgi:NAD(P)-dependent dehydrogenase (short-subunit alcohol dehydrogenase family)
MVGATTLKGKVALLSGGTSGIGLGIAHELGRQGARIAVFGRDTGKAEAAAAGLVAEGIDAIGLAADVREYAAVAAVVEKVTAHFGAPDIIIAAAAGNFVVPAAALSAGGFKAVVDIDLVGTFNLFRAAYDVVTGAGVMIAITAPQARLTMPGQAHVSAAKAGVDALVRALAREWGPAGIRVNAISPGPIAGTEGVERMAVHPATAEAWRAEIPLQHFGEVKDIAALAAFLASPLAAYITGAIIDCDGGWHLGNAGRGWLEDVGVKAS